MFNIGDYLNKVRNMAKGDTDLKAGILASVKEVVGIDLQSNNLTAKEGILIIKTNPIIKNAIFLKKAKLLEVINQRINKRIFDIR